VSFLREYIDAQDEAQRPLDAVTDFSLFGKMRRAFCGREASHDSSSDDSRGVSTSPDLSILADALQEHAEVAGDALPRLGRFLDTHDEERWGSVCNRSVTRTLHALTFLLMHSGMPIILYGTEHYFDSPDNTGEDHGKRVSLWQTGFRTDTAAYQLIGRLNRLRRLYGLNAASVRQVHADASTMIFVRETANASVPSGSSARAFASALMSTAAPQLRINDDLNHDPHPLALSDHDPLAREAQESEQMHVIRDDVHPFAHDLSSVSADTNSSDLGIWIFLNNDVAISAAPMTYCVSDLADGVPFPPLGWHWVDALSGRHAAVDVSGCYTAPDNGPKVLALERLSSAGGGNSSNSSSGASATPGSATIPVHLDGASS